VHKQSCKTRIRRCQATRTWSNKSWRKTSPVTTKLLQELQQRETLGTSRKQKRNITLMREIRMRGKNNADVGAEQRKHLYSPLESKSPVQTVSGNTQDVFVGCCIRFESFDFKTLTSILIGASASLTTYT